MARTCHRCTAAAESNRDFHGLEVPQEVAPAPAIDPEAAAAASAAARAAAEAEDEARVRRIQQKRQERTLLGFAMQTCFIT